MHILSPWALTWDKGAGTAVALVALNDRIDGIFGFPTSQRLDERRPIGATNRDFLARNHWETRLVFRHFKTHLSLTALQLWSATHIAALQAVGNADLTLDYDDGLGGTDSLIIPDAALESCEPRQDDINPLRTVTSYVFRGGALEQVP
jgi:hypothetical protein